MAHIMSIVGIWLGVFFTLSIFSFLYKDNPLYKIGEQVFVGLSAGYLFVIAFYDNLIPNLFQKLGGDFSQEWVLLIPFLLGLMMLAQLFPKIAWVSRYPIATMIGTTAAISMLRYLQSNVIEQLSATLINPFSAPQSGNWVDIVGQVLLVAGTITGLFYFYFSVKPTRAFTLTSKVGIYFLMISFGAAFGYTVMARISLLIGRLQFIFRDALHMIK
jgi:hypothetical protein